MFSSVLEIIGVLLIFSLITGLIFYPLANYKYFSFLNVHKVRLLILSLIVFIVTLISFLRNFDNQQDPDYNSEYTYIVLITSWCCFSAFLFLIIFNRKKV